MSKTSGRPLVAVVVLNWNRPGDTAECLASVLELTYPRVLPILVDNGSSDGSADCLQARFPECTVIRNPRNLGFAEGNNAGIRHALSAGADYVLLLNNDAKIDANALNRLVEVAEADPMIGVVGPVIYHWDRPRVVWFAGGKVVRETAWPIHLGWEQEDLETDGRLLDVDYICGCALMVRAEVARRIGLLDGDYFLLFEDTDYCAHVREAGYRVVLAPDASVWHKGSSTFGGDLSPRYLYYFHRNNLIYVHKRLRGPGQWRAYGAVLRRQMHYVWQLYRRRRPEAGAQGRAVGRAVIDFALGRWGEGW